MRIRALVNQCGYTVPAEPRCAAGAAILATAPFVGGCGEAIRRLVRLDRHIEPEARLVAAYDAAIERFKDDLRERGYL